MNDPKILYLFTRTPLHVGAGASVGAIDQPVVRERHTGFPLIPASSLKGSFADQWEANLEQDKKSFLRIKTRKNEQDEEVVDKVLDSAWLFGSNNDKAAFTGALQFSEARLLAFPIRSAKGSFAWTTCPLLLNRAARDGVIPKAKLEKLVEPPDDQAIFDEGNNSKLALGDKLVIEEYTFKIATPGWPGLNRLGEHLASLLPEDAVWREIANRLVILSNGMMSFFAQNACEIAQHVRISDETGTAEGGALFNQENVPAETLFYALIHATDSRVKHGDYAAKKAPDALDAFGQKVKAPGVFQFGGDASTGLGYCSVHLS